MVLSIDSLAVFLDLMFYYIIKLYFRKRFIFSNQASFLLLTVHNIEFYKRNELTAVPYFLFGKGPLKVR